MPAADGLPVAPLVGEPTISLYLPYVAKTLGGRDGWETPMIIQNADTTATDLELTFYRIADGAPAARRIVQGLQPGTSYADRPNDDGDLAGNTEYSLAIRSFGAKVVAVVNEQRGAGARFVADAYVSEIGGSAALFLPRVTRGADGFVSRIVVQNAAPEATSATALFVGSDGATAATIIRSISPGRSTIIDLAEQRSLDAGASYSVRITAAVRLIAVVNNDREGPTAGAPMRFAYNALLSGANTLYGPYAAKNVPSVGGGSSTITVQNMAPAATTPSLTFTPLGGGGSTRFDGPLLAPGAGWTFALPFRTGDSRQGACGSVASAGCLGDGEFSFSAGAPGAQLAALVTVIGATTAAAYAALSRPADYFLPNVTRTLGGKDGWTTPIIVQSVTAARLTLTWRRFADGRLQATQSLTITPGTAVRIDPRAVPDLADDAQYAVSIAGNGGRLVAVVIELNFQGGDGAAIYPGFFR